MFVPFQVPFPVVTQKSFFVSDILTGLEAKIKMARERGENTSEISPTETSKKC